MAGDPSDRQSPAGSDSGCQVDWSWLAGRTVASAVSTLDTLVITFADGETLTVQASNWKNQPFLAFTPWKAPA